MDTPLLTVKNLSVAFAQDGGETRAYNVASTPTDDDELAIEQPLYEADISDAQCWLYLDSPLREINANAGVAELLQRQREVLTLKLPMELADLASERLKNRLQKLGKLLARRTAIINV